MTGFPISGGRREHESHVSRPFDVPEISQVSGRGGSDTVPLDRLIKIEEDSPYNEGTSSFRIELIAPDPSDSAPEPIPVARVEEPKLSASNIDIPEEQRVAALNHPENDAASVEVNVSDRRGDDTPSAEESTEDKANRNPARVIPEPLETVLENMGRGIVPAYVELPEVINASALEAYANSLSQQTQEDPLHGERGAVLDIDVTTGTIMYPEILTVGHKLGVDLELPEQREGLVHTLHIHTHPTDGCFSIGDMGTLIGGNAESGEYFLPSAMLVATPGYNYLMLKSQETTTEDWSEVAKKAFSPTLRTEFNALVKETKSNDFPFKGEEGEALSRNLQTYHRSFSEAVTLAKLYRLGFYRSNRDGNYTRLTREQVMEHVTEYFREALRTR